MQQLDQQQYDLLVRLPNLPGSLVRPGKSADENEVVFQVDQLPQLPENALPHWELAKKYDLIDFELGVKISGAGFPVYKGKGARLQRALINYFLDKGIEAGYFEVQPPILVNEASGFGTGQLPDKEGQMYHAPIDNLYLIPTAEVSLTNLVREAITSEEELPLRLTALTNCFRAEAGSAGRDTKGMIRQHQFQKVELVSITTPEQSAAEHERMTECAETILKKLGLSFRTMLLCTGDMGFGARKTYDLEVWLPSQNTYREISSCSNCGDFQARRMDARIRKTGEKGTRFAHTLNGSGLAVGRTLVAIMENYQDEGGRIAIPDVLQPYMGGLKHIG
ncbi:MAG: serine--tRNA ligase [Asticcacaulis sp. 32-58-5]|nr:MAG: serine--tRNA ligase [Asticcacaulis sp. 32-58-5]